MGRVNLYISFVFLLLVTLPAKERESKRSLSVATDGTNYEVVSDSSFVVFDGMGSKGKPDLTQYGLKPIHLIYASRLWKKNRGNLKGTTSLPSRTLIEKQARQARQENDIAVIDIEHWPVNGDEQAVQQSVDRYIEVLESFQESTPGVKYGFYQVPPVHNYWSAIRDTSSSRYKNWEEKNRRLKELAGKIDVFFPSLYTYYNDRERWVRYAIANIKQVRKYNEGKPVYVFLWPQYHTYNKEIGGEFIDPEFWKLQLETARKYADGIVIWTPWRLEWDSKAAWWDVTKEFMHELNNKKS